MRRETWIYSVTTSRAIERVVEGMDAGGYLGFWDSHIVEFKKAGKDIFGTSGTCVEIEGDLRGADWALGH